MATTNQPSWRPTWWDEKQHGSAWDRVKEAMHRDWEQTKHDFKRDAGKELKQNAGDTIAQATGSEAIPPTNVANPKPTEWNDVEMPLKYGYGARSQYGTKSNDWSDDVEKRLRTEWESNQAAKASKWDEVKPYVRRGWEYDNKKK